MDLRPYQKRAIAEVHEAWNNGAKRVCLVMPTGAGKTFTADQITKDMSAVWLVHRRELLDQAPGRAFTVQQLCQSDYRPAAKILVADECHHLAPGAEKWHGVARDYPRILGLTATPQRSDGSPLGDLFDHMVVGAQYSELLEGKWIVPARVYRPCESVQGLAQKPIEAYRKFSEDSQGFAYFSRVDLAHQFAANFRREDQIPMFDDGECADIITAKTKKRLRDEIVRKFKNGEIHVLSNVFTLTEGIDVPAARVCLIARGCEHHGTYLQMVGRVLRPSAGKKDAIVIDLPGVSHKHGLPTVDRLYSLSGRAIRTKLEPLRNCPECGLTQPSALGACERCGYVWPIDPPKKPRIWNMPLEEALATASTAKDKKIAKWRQKQVDKPREQKRAEYLQFRATGELKGYKPGWAAYQYKLRFGEWPPREFK